MKIYLLCSWGGHLQETLELRDAWGAYDYRFITYVSERSIALKEPKWLIAPPWKSIPKFLYTLAKTSIKILFNRPDVLMSTGMGYVDIFLFPLCKLLGVYTIYIESGANVEYVSGTANFVRKFCNKFIVRWEDLAEKIGAEYHGGIF